MAWIYETLEMTSGGKPNGRFRMTKTSDEYGGGSYGLCNCDGGHLSRESAESCPIAIAAHQAAFPKAEEDEEKTYLEQEIARLKTEVKELCTQVSNEARHSESQRIFYQGEIAKKNAELKKDAEFQQLLMAVGCASTIKGSMVMRADDPLGMMQEVCSYVKELRAERDEAIQSLRKIAEQVAELTARVGGKVRNESQN